MQHVTRVEHWLSLYMLRLLLPCRRFTGPLPVSSTMKRLVVFRATSNGFEVRGHVLQQSLLTCQCHRACVQRRMHVARCMITKGSKRIKVRPMLLHRILALALLLGVDQSKWHRNAACSSATKATHINQYSDTDRSFYICRVPFQVPCTRSTTCKCCNSSATLSVAPSRAKWRC